MPKTKKNKEVWQQWLLLYSRTHYHFGREERPRKGSHWDAELNKTTSFPRQGGGGGGGKDVMGRPIRCTCGYHVALLLLLYNNVIVDIIIANTFYMHPGQSHARYIYLTKLNTTIKLPIITGIVDNVLVLNTLITVCIIYTMQSLSN